MKKIIQIFVFFIGITSFSQDGEAFQRANALYNQEKYQEAVDTYISILDTGKESASLYYNLGNAYYKLSQIGSSIYYYEKALELTPNDEDIKNNLGFARNATIDAIDVIPEGIVTKTANKIINLFSFDTWAWISVFSVILFVIFFMLYYSAHESSRKRLFFASSWLTLIVVILGVFFAFKQFHHIESNQYAIIFNKETVIMSEPNLRSDEVFELHEGTKVKVIETVNNWKKIKLADGKIGWIPATDIKEL